MSCKKQEQVEIGLEGFTQEVAAMLKVCFEGKVKDLGEAVRITFPSGEAFDVSVKAVLP